ncbi:CHAT domain-containing protein [Coleofasciculus sp. FACHB-712]|uniref:CHAT domain-containing tetratricopeptide repeat protein n=1 Tax=Coleofasciculus sp. FACHB-712 TaxID=2692789 RepID=UPI0016862FD1|nr:CHAT domain-containing tetratricopeptide repeat protein [Coleofasciculus sp. FACHB-712]MBD1943865.1 CHAT domain-containing protein [Coleofasciculus sp. FACHB-712]
MHSRKISLIAFITLAATVSTPLATSFPALRTPRVLAQTQADRKAEADRLLQQGFQQLQTSQFEAALQSWQQALTIYREIKDRQGEGAVLGNLGVVYRNLGDYAKAIDYSQQWLAIARSIKDRQSEGTALGNLGIAYLSLGDYAKAIEYAQQVLAIARSIKDRQSEGAALGKLGVAYDSLGDYAKAIEYQQQWLAIARSIKDRQSEGAALGNLGVAYRNLGDYAKAIEYAQQVLAIARSIKDRQSEGTALGNLGIAYLSLRDYAKAIEYAQQVLAIARSIKDRQREGAALGSLGIAYLSLGGYAKAIEYTQQWLAIARSIKDRQSEGTALGNLGAAYGSLGDYAKAIEYAQQWLAIAREIKDRQGEGTALNNLGLALYESGNLAVAEKTLIDGIEVLESLRERLGSDDANKISIFEQQARTYRTLQQVLIAQNKTDAALEIAERGRARAFVELLSRRLSPNSVETLPAKYLQPTISQIQQIAKTQNATLVQYSIIDEDVKVQGKQQTKESELYIWIIKPTGEVAFRRSDLKPLWQKENFSLKNLVVNTRQSMGVRGRGGIAVALIEEASLTKRLQQLHQLLIEPIAKELPPDPNARVIFIPQTELFLVPFPALQDANGKYLIEKHTILTAPSIQVLDLTHQQRQRVETQSIPSLQEALVVGNPIMPKVVLNPGELAQQLSNLPWAEQEAKDIAKLLKTQAITGSQATKVAIAQALPKARIIHLATHGLLDDYRGLGSAIALAPSNQNDGLLTAEEILNLKLNAELVVLSACDTGRGRITGDGVIGLSRSLISAGVPSVVVSLWQVPDNSTAFLMTEFYKNLQQKADKATALRNAMLTTMKQQQYSDPVQWAAFTLIGEAE